MLIRHEVGAILLDNPKTNMPTTDMSSYIKQLRAQTSALWMRSILWVFSEMAEEMRTKYQIYELLRERSHSNECADIRLSSIEEHLQMCIDIGLLVQLSAGIYMRTREGRALGNEYYHQCSGINSQMRL